MRLLTMIAHEKRRTVFQPAIELDDRRSTKDPVTRLEDDAAGPHFRRRRAQAPSML
jgi:hypothetical protein